MDDGWFERLKEVMGITCGAVSTSLRAFLTSGRVLIVVCLVTTFEILISVFGLYLMVWY